MKAALMLLSGFMLCSYGVVSCQVFNLSKPRVIQYPEPNLSVDQQALINAGCTLTDYGDWDCAPGSPALTEGCDTIKVANDLLGGLDPNYPLAVCMYYPLQHKKTSQEPYQGDFLYRGGCTLPRTMMPIYLHFLVSKGDDQFTVLKTMSDLQSIYSPIDSPDEALSYAIAATGLEAYYDIQPQAGYRYDVKQLEETHVSESPGGYEVLLYQFQMFGQPAYTTNAVIVQVSYEGEISIINTTLVNHTPEEDGLCVDGRLLKS
jgi:hypothetical protein